MKNNVAITGIMGSGKSHVAHVLESNGYEVFKMAKPLKTIVEKSFNLEEGDIEGLKSSTIRFTLLPVNHARKLAKNILMSMDFSEFGADARINESSVMASPIPPLGGISGEQMVYQITDLLSELYSTGGTYRNLLQRLGTDLMRTWNPDIHIEFARVGIKDIRKNIVIDDARFENELEFVRTELGAKVYWLHRPALKHTDFHESETSISESDADVVVKSLEGDLLTDSTMFFVDKGYWHDDVVM